MNPILWAAADAAACTACDRARDGSRDGAPRSCSRRRTLRRAMQGGDADGRRSVDDPACRPAEASDWRRVAATIDRSDTIPGPFGQRLERLGNAQNPFARIDGPPVAGLAPGARALFSAVVAAPTALSSALVLSSAFGQAELRVDWTETPPGFVLFDRRGGLIATAGDVEALGFDAWRLALEARNESPDAMEVRPSLHVASGIGNAGMAVGLYAGMLRAGCATEPAPGCREGTDD